MVKKAAAKKTAKSPSVTEMRKQFEREIEKGLRTVEKEAAKIRKSVDASVKQADAFIRKNPEKATAIASAIAAALGAAAALIATHGKRGKK